MNKTFMAVLLTLGSAFGQHLSVGIKGGVPITGAFTDFTANGVDTITHTFSDSKQYVVGPTIELHLPLGLSVEADGFYRPLNLATETRIAPSTVFRSVTNITSWEFPILGKFRLPFPIVKPYVEAGPSFRWVGSNASYLSNTGVSFGGGVELKLERLRLGPEIRYTRWASDAPAPRGVAFFAPSSANQTEFLVGISF